MLYLASLKVTYTVDLLVHAHTLLLQEWCFSAYITSIDLFVYLAQIRRMPGMSKAQRKLHSPPIDWGLELPVWQCRYDNGWRILPIYQVYQRCDLYVSYIFTASAIHLCPFQPSHSPFSYFFQRFWGRLPIKSILDVNLWSVDLSVFGPFPVRKYTAVFVLSCIGKFVLGLLRFSPENICTLDYYVLQLVLWKGDHLSRFNSHTLIWVSNYTT